MTALTLVMPLKGRRLHTMRFFWHAARQRLRYRIVVADGKVEEAVAARLAPPHSLFPALGIDYARCADDVTYQHYFDKLMMAASRATTPYVMLCDNDDFVVPAGIDACIGFLDRHRDYAGISGGVAGFSLHHEEALPQVCGAIQSLGSMYHDGYKAEDYAAPRLSDRVCQNFRRGYTLYYSVFRRQALVTVLGEIASLGFSDLKAVETFFAARMKTLGKCRLDRSTISYVRQRGTSGGAPSVWTLDDVRGIGPRMAEVNRCLLTLAQPIAAAAGARDDEMIGILRRQFIDKLTAEGCNSEGASPDWREGLRNVVRAVAPDTVDRRRQTLRQQAREEIAESMRIHGADAAAEAKVMDQLGAIEATVEGPDFADFMRRYAPDILERDMKNAVRKEQQGAT